MNLFRSILVAANVAQEHAIECLNDTWLISGDSAEIASYPPAQQASHQPLLRAATWYRSGNPRAAALAQGSEPLLLMLLGPELLFWDEGGTGLWLPGLPGVMGVRFYDKATPTVHPRETAPYYAISGAVALHGALLGYSLLGDEDETLYMLQVLPGNPDELDCTDLERPTLQPAQLDDKKSNLPRQRGLQLSINLKVEMDELEP